LPDATGSSLPTGPVILSAGCLAKPPSAAAQSDPSSTLGNQPGTFAAPSVTCAPAVSTQSGPVATVDQSKDHTTTHGAVLNAPDGFSEPAVGAAVPPEIGRDEKGGLSIRLSLPHIGALEIQVVDDSNGKTSLVIGAQREDTLRALIGDQARLHASLRDSGIQPEGRTIEFSLLAPSSFDTDASRRDPGAQDNQSRRHAAASDGESGVIGPTVGSARLSGQLAGCGRSLNLIDITA
jgi:hypothetical protein